MKWFRLWVEWGHDPKVQSMPEHMRCRHIMLLCLRREADPSKLTNDELAFHFRITQEELQETKDLFHQKGFIDNGWNVLAWDKRQPSSDSSKARTRKWRKRKEKKKGDVTETSQGRHGDIREQNREENKDSISFTRNTCPTSTSVDAAQILRELLKKEQPNARVPTLSGLVVGRNSWAHIIDRMIRIDGRSPPGIIETIKWLYSPTNLDGEASFVVQSAQALREKYDRIQTQMKKHKPRRVEDPMKDRLCKNCHSWSSTMEFDEGGICDRCQALPTS